MFPILNNNIEISPAPSEEWIEIESPSKEAIAKKEEFMKSISEAEENCVDNNLFTIDVLANELISADFKEKPTTYLLWLKRETIKLLHRELEIVIKEKKLKNRRH